MQSRNVELETAEALLDIGVSVPFKEVKIPFTKKRIKFRLTMRRPCLGNQIRIGRQYVKLGTTYEEMKAFDKDQEMQFLAKHGATVATMIALTVCRGFISGWLLTPLMRFIILWGVPDRFIMAANLHFVTLIGTRNFTNIIRSTEAVNPLKPKLSQQEKGS